MGRLRIPRHRADKQPEFIPLTDTAWDTERVSDEIDGLEDDEKVEHPFFAYHLGQTRYDLDAQDDKERTARQYLKPNEKPEIWELRRLKVDEWYEVRGLFMPGRDSSAALRACRLGVTGVKNWEGAKLKGLERDGALSSADMQVLHEEDPGVLGEVTVCGIPWSMTGLESLPVQIGNAVIGASRPPTDAEKKASVS